MSRFRVEEKQFGVLPSIKIIDDTMGASIEIDQMGAALLNYFVKTHRGPLNLIDGFQSYEEMLAGKSPRSAILAPFYGRMQNDSYTFDGETFSVGENNAINGLISREKFQVANIEINSDSACISLTCDKLITSPVDYYPFQIEIAVNYTLSGRKLFVEIIGKNTGLKSAPFACAWHPYFRLSEKGIDSLALNIPFERLVLTDSNFIPYSKEMAFSSISNLPGSDFRPQVFQKKRIIGRRMLSACYANKVIAGNGAIESRIENLDNGSVLTLKQPRGVLFCSTGNEMQERFREAIILHPAEFVWNAFNRSDLADAIRLEPGAERKFSTEIEFSQP